MVREFSLPLSVRCVIIAGFVIGAALTAPFTYAEVEATSTSSGATTTTTTAEVVATNDRWFTSEMISGNNIQSGDFVVGPGRIEVTIKPGESVTKMMTVTNRVSDNRGFELMVEDMSGSADPSQATVLLGDQKGPYTLKDYFSFPGKKLNLKLGERAQIPVTITMPANAEPGGYYGAVLVTTLQDDGKNEEGTTARSPIIARIGTLFFITVPGNTNIEGALKSITTKNNQWWFQNGPVDLALLFENTGSMHLNPYGEIHVNNMFGEEVGYVELEPWFVLPKSLRLREVAWDRELLVGRYTITAKINRGYDDVIDEKTIAIWVLPWKVLAAIFGTLFIIFFLVRLFLRTFEFKRKS